MPEGWVWTSIDDIAFVTKLAGFEYTEYIANNLTGHDGVPLFKGKNVQDGKIIYHFESFIPKEISDELPRSQVRRKCLLTPYVGTIGNIGIHDKEGFYHLGSNVGKIEILNGNQTDIYEEYVKLFLQSTSGYKELTKQKKATAQDSISIEAIREVLIPIPPRGEQQRILQEISHWLSFVESIEQAETSINDTICAAKARILELAIHGKLVPQDPSDKPAIELLKRINPAFKPSDNLHYADRFPTGWAEFPLYAICEILDSQRKPVNSKEREKRVEKAKTLYPYYGATGQVGLIDNYILDGDYLLLGEDGAPFLDRYANKAYSVSGRIWVNNHAHILKPRINPTYMMYYLNAIQYRPYVTGTTRLKLTQEVMRNIPVLVPPLAEQARIISRVEQLFRVIDAIQLDK